MADPLNIVTIAASANILKRGWGRECCYVELKMRLEKLNGTQTDTPCTRDSRTMKNADCISLSPVYNWVMISAALHSGVTDVGLKFVPVRFEIFELWGGNGDFGNISSMNLHYRTQPAKSRLSSLTMIDESREHAKQTQRAVKSARYLYHLWVEDYRWSKSC